jgi:carboxyl-terminal processing protease
MENPQEKTKKIGKGKLFFFTLFILLIILSNSLSFGLGYFTGDKLFSTEILKTTSHIENKDSENTPEKIDFDAFWKAWTILDKKFVSRQGQEEEITDEEKLWGAISGLARAYDDPYTNFFPPEEKDIFESDISGEFVGIGVEISYKDGFLTVVSPLSDTPAFKAGMKAGDIISKIDDTDSIDMLPTNAVKLIRGEIGKPVVLTVIREGESKPLEITIIRDTIKIPTIKTELVDGVFVVKLYSFSTDSASLTKDAMEEFSRSGTDKLILDLRGNPGGILQAAVQIGSFFLEKDKVIVTSDYGKNSDQVEYLSKGYNFFTDKLKLVILIDGGSASASEILAGALRQHNRALLVGDTTFGKGSVQELVPVTENTSLKVTVAKWILPDGNNISDEGVEPDFKVLQDTDSEDATLDKAFEVIKSKDFFENFNK